MYLLPTKLVLAAGLSVAALAMTAQAQADTTLNINGHNGADSITLRLAPANAQTLQVDINGHVSEVARDTFTRIHIDGGNGDDVVFFDQSNGTINTPSVVEGGRGDDTLFGGRGADTLIGGRGDDVLVWNPGDGSDVLQGGSGHDTMTFNGASGPEQFDASADGGHVRFFRAQGGIVMDLAGVEQIDLNALGGADLLTVNDLSGTELETLNADLAPSIGGSVSDGAADRVVVNGTAGDDAIVASGSAGSATVTGLATTVNVLHAGVNEGDVLHVNGLAGNDTIDGSGLAPGAIGFESQP
jgi:hypothetical protein